MVSKLGGEFDDPPGCNNNVLHRIHYLVTRRVQNSRFGKSAHDIAMWISVYRRINNHEVRNVFGS